MEKNSELFKWFAGGCQRTCVYGPERSQCGCRNGECKSTNIPGFEQAKNWPKIPQAEPITKVFYFRKRP